MILIAASHFIKKMMNRMKSGADNERKDTEQKETGKDATIQQVTLFNSDTGRLIGQELQILRIYSGNVDLQSTYKTICLSPQMSVADVIEAALKRFRIEAPGADYYLSVLHLDSGISSPSSL